MKPIRYALSLCFFLIVSTLQAQQYNYAAAPTSEFHALVPVDDSADAWIAGGYEVDPVFGERPLLHAVNRFNEVLWAYHWPDSVPYNQVTDLDRLPDNRVVVTGVGNVVCDVMLPHQVTLSWMTTAGELLQETHFQFESQGGLPLPQTVVQPDGSGWVGYASQLIHFSATGDSLGRILLEGDTIRALLAPTATSLAVSTGDTLWLLDHAGNVLAQRAQQSPRTALTTTPAGNLLVAWDVQLQEWDQTTLETLQQAEFSDLLDTITALVANDTSYYVAGLDVEHGTMQLYRTDTNLVRPSPDGLRQDYFGMYLQAHRLYVTPREDLGIVGVSRPGLKPNAFLVGVDEATTNGLAFFLPTIPVNRGKLLEVTVLSTQVQEKVPYYASSTLQVKITNDYSQPAIDSLWITATAGLTPWCSEILVHQHFTGLHMTPSDTLSLTLERVAHPFSGDGTPQRFCVWISGVNGSFDPVDSDNLICADLIVTDAPARLTQMPLRLYPNPAKHRLRIDFGTMLRASPLQVVNALGQQVHSCNVTGDHTELDLASWPAGVYLVVLPETGQTARLVRE
ncbi:Por secretion system C-terminal sorting domain-containing protein [Catalinimonas alkaloidigena]|uniref:Por secretion system C-terminal sorting domain-containing protein n=1 Tax=Catalinimonas alkaloidigena TaxID=1075417 RepID=A0A1G9HDM6_9BACT|nr:T9SS type A sorting domain-containing protein [Catalinimonas alkaloidigena]SDL10945.1 Por secretion system C-terminal sorting domain-containing protein [Catalinimonas alkaloidigena]